MLSVLLASLAALGTALLLGNWLDLDGSSQMLRRRMVGLRSDMRSWMLRTGLDGVSPTQFIGVSVGVGLIGTVASAVVLGIGVPSLVIGLATASGPGAVWRRRRVADADEARQAWPAIIEELRVRVGSAGRPVPQGLLEAGLRGPSAIRSAFVAAQREWALTTDFPRTVAVLKDRLRDPTADAVCETLLVVHEVGGDLDGRLADLAEDRRAALGERAEAGARQAGARLARWFVVIVPAGMAFAGASLGSGSEAYRSPAGQAATAVAIGLVALCWWWAGRIMTISEPRRVFDR